jgi:hypothetical protein
MTEQASPCDQAQLANRARPGTAAAMGHIPRNRRISPIVLARLLPAGGGRREFRDGTREDVAESAAS